MKTQLHGGVRGSTAHSNPFLISAVMEQDLEALGPFLSRVDHLLIELPVVFRPRKAIQAQLGQLWRGLHGENTDFPDVLADFGVISAEM